MVLEKFICRLRYLMYKTFLKRISLNLAFVCFAAAGSMSAQTPTETRQVNFRYTQNPKTKPKPENQVMQTTADTGKNASIIEVSQKTEPEQNAEFESRSIARKTLEVARRAAPNAPPTEIYKIGIGDVLFISLQNAPPKDSTYFTVLNDGAIDYPLAGEMMPVQGLTAGEVEDLLREKIKLYENPQVSVKVREHASHRVTVFGLVEKPGEKYLQREAIPLYVVKAEAIVLPNAGVVVIKRVNSDTEKIDLKDPKADEILVFPGDIVEFKSTAPDSAKAPQFYYIGGSVASVGQKDFHPGITLTQAILASGGLKKTSVKNVVIRRKNDAGLLSPIEFDLKAIKDGKQPDPILQAGDTVEIGN